MKKVALALLVALVALSSNAFAIVVADIDGTDLGEWATGLIINASDPNEAGILDDYDFQFVKMIQNDLGGADDGMFILMDLYGTPNFTSLDPLQPPSPVFYRVGFDSNSDGDFLDAADRSLTYNLASGLSVYNGSGTLLGTGTAAYGSVMEMYVPETLMGGPLGAFQTFASLDSGGSEQSDDRIPDVGFNTSVPEPASMALLGFGLLGVIGTSFKKRFVA